MTTDRLRVLMLGDFVGRPAREGLKQAYSYIRNTLNIDLLIVNAENASGGNGIVPKNAVELHDLGVDVITLGDHTFHKRAMYDFLDQASDWCIRPANYPEGTSGSGSLVWKDPRSGTLVQVCNVMGRVFMQGSLDCPFRKADQLLQEKPEACVMSIFDFHAEASSEACAFAQYLDGRASLVAGTHTHVQTADARVQAGGTAMISDLGMSGYLDTVIGMDTSVALERFISGMPRAYKLGSGTLLRLCGVLVELDCTTGKALSIEAVQLDPEACVYP